MTHKNWNVFYSMSWKHIQPFWVAWCSRSRNLHFYSLRWRPQISYHCFLGGSYGLFSVALVHEGRESQGGLLQQWIASENLIVPFRLTGVPLSHADILKLWFKQTVGTIQCSEGGDVKFNCSIDLTNLGQDLGILWFKNGKEISDGTQTTVHTRDTLSLLSTIRLVEC